MLFHSSRRCMRISVAWWAVFKLQRPSGSPHLTLRELVHHHRSTGKRNAFIGKETERKDNLRGGGGGVLTGRIKYLHWKYDGRYRAVAVSSRFIRGVQKPAEGKEREHKSCSVSPDESCSIETEVRVCFDIKFNHFLSTERELRSLRVKAQSSPGWRNGGWLEPTFWSTRVRDTAIQMCNGCPQTGWAGYRSSWTHAARRLRKCTHCCGNNRFPCH